MFWFFTSFTTRQDTKTSGSSTTPIYDKALRRYKKVTGQDLCSHPFVARLENYRSTEVRHIFDELAQKFYIQDNFELGIYLRAMINTLIGMSDLLERRSGGVTAFPPAKAVFVGICGFLSEAYDLEASYGTIIDIMTSILLYLLRFEIYSSTPTAAEVEIMEKVIAEFIFILAMLTKAAKRGTIECYVHALIGTSKIQDAMNTMHLLTRKVMVDRRQVRH